MDWQFSFDDMPLPLGDTWVGLCTGAVMMHGHTIEEIWLDAEGGKVRRMSMFTDDQAMFKALCARIYREYANVIADHMDEVRPVRELRIVDGEVTSC